MARSIGFSVVDDVALRELLRHRLQTWCRCRPVGARAVQRGGIDVGEFGARRLRAEGVGVGDVVADDLEVLARGVQARKGLAGSSWSVPGGGSDQLKALTVS